MGVGLSMLVEHTHLFCTDKSFEVFKVILRTKCECIRGFVPVNPMGGGEELLHELRLRGNCHLHIAITKFRVAFLLDGGSVFVYSVHGILERHELDITVISLAGNAVHDNMDRLLLVVEDASAAAQESDDLGTGDLIGDLEES